MRTKGKIAIDMKESVSEAGLDFLEVTEVSRNVKIVMAVRAVPFKVEIVSESLY